MLVDCRGGRHAVLAAFGQALCLSGQTEKMVLRRLEPGQPLGLDNVLVLTAAEAWHLDHGLAPRPRPLGSAFGGAAGGPAAAGWHGGGTAARLGARYETLGSQRIGQAGRHVRGKQRGRVETDLDRGRGRLLCNSLTSKRTGPTLVQRYYYAGPALGLQRRIGKTLGATMTTTPNQCWTQKGPSWRDSAT